jgi:DNA-binding response OmpR family regulator
MAKKVLIVDDDPDILELLRSAFERVGYVAQTAATGWEGLEKARRSRPDLIVLDLVLPDLNGINVCESLRRNTATASIPILMITGQPGEFPRLAGVEAGINAFVAKPFDIPQLVERAKSLVNPTAAPNDHTDSPK